MKTLLTIAAAGLILSAGAATAGESLDAGFYDECATGVSVKSVSTVPTATAVPTKTASETKTPPKSGG